ncbi:hypothetical protein AAC387_Pa12g2239 [Persea americana]
MEDMVSLLLTISGVSVLTWIVRLVNWIWWKPMKLERELRKQGFRGPPYRLLYGCMKENSRMTEEGLVKAHESQPSDFATYGSICSQDCQGIW